MRKEEIYLTQRDTIHKTTIIIDLEIEATIAFQNNYYHKYTITTTITTISQLLLLHLLYVI